jgi:transcriptional regulator with XRE-family HTH domain
MPSSLSELLFKKYMDWQRQVGERKTLKEFAEYIGIGQVYLNRIMNGRRSAGEKTIMHLAEFFHDMKFYDAVDLPRPDPALTFIIRHWGDLPVDIQTKISEEIKHYGK